MDINLHLCKRSKFQSSVAEYSAYDQQGILYLEFCREDKCDGKCSYHKHTEKLGMMAVFITWIVVMVTSGYITSKFTKMYMLIMYCFCMPLIPQ